MTTATGLALPELDGLTDHELVSHFINGEESAFEVLFNRHSRMVYATCLRIVRDPSAAEDALQSVFIIFSRKASSLSPNTNIGGWLYITARTCALKLRQQREVRHNYESQHEPAISSDDEPPDVQDFKQLIDQALATLPSVQRDAIVTHYLGQKSVADTARILDCPIETVHTRLTRGMARLRKHCRTLSVATITSLLTGLSSAEISAEASKRIIATTLNHLAPTASVSALAASVISQSAMRSLVGFIIAGAVPLVVGVTLWLWFADKEEPEPVAPEIVAEPQPNPAPQNTVAQNTPVTPPVVVQPQPDPAFDPLAGWTFVGLPAVAAAETRDNKTVQVLRLGQLVEVEPFGKAIRPLVTGPGGFICEYDWKTASDFVNPRLFFGAPMDDAQLDMQFRKSNFTEKDYAQNRADHTWYKNKIRCVPVPTGWQISQGDGEGPDQVYVVPTLPDYFVMHVFNGLIDIDNWRCEALAKPAGAEL